MVHGARSLYFQVDGRTGLSDPTVDVVMLIWVLMVHVSCSGHGFIQGQPKDCAAETVLTYSSEQECKDQIERREIPYGAVPYDDLFCQMRWR